MTSQPERWDDGASSGPSRYDQPGYDRQPGYDQRGYDQQPDYDDQRGYDQQPGYDQRVYDQQPGYDQRGYERHADYDRPGYETQPGYDQRGYDQRGYDQQAGYDPRSEAAQRRPAPAGRRGSRSQANRRRAQAREIRWQNNRLAVPYYTDGPKITFGVGWFALVVACLFVSPLVLALLTAFVAALAGLQIGAAWFPQFDVTKWWMGAAAFVVGMSGLLGPLGLIAGCGFGAALLLVYLVLNPVHHRSMLELLDVLFRAAIPVGIATGSLVALRGVSLGAVLLLVALVSAYEAGDFLVGSGSSNAVEGPVSGLVALAVVAFVAWILAPAPFTNTSVVYFSALAAVCCPLGQIVGAALLPRGSAWAPALRRLDSYLLAAPLWLVLLAGVSSSTTL